MKKVITKSKMPKQKHQINVEREEEKTTPSKPKKMGSEIDEIFAAKKHKRPENEKKGGDAKPAKVAAAKVRPSDKKKRKSSETRSAEEKNSFSDRVSQRRRKTADGLSIFTEEELGIGKPDAGGTASCPFDCDCCF